MGTSGKFLLRAARFGGDRCGNFAILTAATISTIAMGAGFGINVAQMSLTRSNLLQALDSAVTSTARDLTTRKIEPADARTMVATFLQSNGGTGFASEDRIVLDSVVVDKTARTVEAVATVDIDLAFPLFKAAANQRITVTSKALYSDKHIEVAMMLDITDSMKGQKLKDLKTAAKNAVGTFLTNQSADDPRVRIAIVPYADAVNVGPLARVVHYETGYTQDAAPGYGSAADVSDATSWVAGGGGFRPDDCATERKGDYQFSSVGPWGAMPSRDSRLRSCPEVALEPLTSNKKRLEDTIDRFKISGVTAGHIGIQWSWYMLSRDWKEALPAASAPAARSDAKAAKFAILMTDGEFNTAFAGVGRWDETRVRQPEKSRSYAERLCAEMKKEGIEVFTVGFMLTEKNAKQVMSKCASPDTSSAKHYFEAATGDELNAAFLAIAANIERLAIVK